MLRSLLRGVTFGTLAVWFFSACSSDGNNGPPTTPCNDQTKGAAPICGKTCANKCGCGTCQPGAQTFIGSVAYVCTGNCFSLASGTGGTSAGGGGTTSTGGSGGSGGLDCKTVDCNADPPVCGACTTCPCCSCNENATKDIGGVTHLCTSGCFQPLSADGG
ncbi:MAG: hypothetical protein IPI67_07305 [Myxococcales bacterium]|nr:hypothetical protein [Myxococcales bacterium]